MKSNVEVGLCQFYYVNRIYFAACMLHTIESQFGDISEYSVAELGCGSGRLAIGCAMLGAR